MKGILGRKVGMTQVFTKTGKLIPVTVISVEPNVVTQIKTLESNGYEAIQLGYETVRPKSSNKAKMGHTNKANTEPKRFLREIRGVNVSNYNLGDVLKADIFVAGEVVDVSGMSKGKGFQGVIKRHNQSRGPMSHGSQYHRGVGSMGTLRPARVLKGKKLPGHMGNQLVTVQNLEVIEVDLENNVILIKGNVPGPKKSLVMIRTSVKKGEKINQLDDLVSYVEIALEDADTVSEEVEVVESVEEVVAEATEEVAEETTEEVTESEEEAEVAQTEEVVEETTEEAVAAEEVVEENEESQAEETVEVTETEEETEEPKEETE